MTTVDASGLDQQGKIKCVVWDLDETVWEGTLLTTPGTPRVRDHVVDVMRTLDARGILQSVASRNDPDVAWPVLAGAGIAELYLHPQIGWGAKSASVARIAQALNIGLESIAFVDDQAFELAEVSAEYPSVTCILADALEAAIETPAFNPRFITDESRRRRQLYLSADRRDCEEENFEGPSAEFMASLGLTMRIEPASHDDLRRAEELTVRTNQLNSTGITHSFEELVALAGSSDHLVLVASIEDRFGSYGKIGLAVVGTSSDDWTLMLLIVSCRVVSRGVGTILLNDVMRRAKKVGVGLVADFVDTGRNRMMFVTYAFAGFTEEARDDGRVLLRCSLDSIQDVPSYVELVSR